MEARRGHRVCDGASLLDKRGRTEGSNVTQRTKARLQPCLKKWTIVHLCAESAASSREPQRNRVGAESALADALGLRVLAFQSTLRCIRMYAVMWRF
jgi:hypothetical protein